MRFPNGCPFAALAAICLSLPLAAEETKTEGKILLEETFTDELSEDWHWGLGTWTAKKGILRGFESGPRRHGPVKMRKFPFTEGVLEVEFQLEGEAKFAGVGFNGNRERGHIAAVVIARNQLRIIAHPIVGKAIDLLRVEAIHKPETWHRVRITFRGETMIAEVDGKKHEVLHPCLAEEKLVFSLGGDSGGPEGESAGALEFRKLKLSKLP